VTFLGEDKVVLIKRAESPFKGLYAIPGGFVEYGETVEDAAVREMKEETGLDVKLLGIIGVYSKPDRDPRGHVVSIAYLAEAVGGSLKPSTETEEVKAFKIDEVPENLAFDHKDILKDGIKNMQTRKVTVEN
jgi:8-oxo-dGTP diphosphatase